MRNKREFIGKKSDRTNPFDRPKRFSKDSRDSKPRTASRAGGKKNDDDSKSNKSDFSSPRKNNFSQTRTQRPRSNKPKTEDFTKETDIRLNRCLANAGVCSRRDADVYIQAGVVKVNGEVVTELGTRVKATDKIMFHDQLVQSEKKVYILLNKPKNTVTTVTDPHGRITVMDIVRNACSERIYPVGRLDRNTTGVLLLTNDGDMAIKLTHPKYEKKKIYQVSLDKPLEETDFDKILAGVHLADGFIKADQLEYVKDTKRKEIGIEIHSGRNRIVRRIFESLGYKVEKLDRVYFAGLTKLNLPRGRFRHLTEQEVAAIKMGAFE